jgi:hypothetical protein
MHHRATTIMVGIGATDMAGGIIAIGGDFSPQARGEAALVGGLFLFIQPLVSPIKDVRSWVAIADKPDMASTA